MSNIIFMGTVSGAVALGVIALITVLVKNRKNANSQEDGDESGAPVEAKEPMSKKQIIMPVIVAMIIGAGGGAFASYRLQVSMESQGFRTCMADTLMNDQRFTSLGYTQEEAEYKASEIYDAYETHGEETAIKIMQRISRALVENECAFTSE